MYVSKKVTECKKTKGTCICVCKDVDVMSVDKNCRIPLFMNQKLWMEHPEHYVWVTLRPKKIIL
jgi:hypothetical protein